MVITAPTPITMPRAVSTERSLLARIACRATITVSPNSMLPPDLHPGRAGTPAHPGDGVAAHPVLHLLAFLLLRDQAGAGQDEHGVGVGEPVHDLGVVEVCEAGPNRHGSRLTLAQHEDDVA